MLIRPDGQYLAMWSGHRIDCITRASIFNGTAWGAEKKIDWAPYGCPWAGASTNMVTYSNPWYMGTTILAGVRSVDTSPAFLTSSDNGVNWSYYGRLTTTPQMGYVAGYYKYWGDNVGRIDFVATEAHPRDVDTNLWHGYIQDGKVYNSVGTEVDASLMDANSTTSSAKDISAYTKVFATGTTIKGVQLEHAWNHDIVRYADGTIAVLWQARVTGTGTDDPDKRILYARFDGTSWKSTYLVKAGTKLYPAEQDYTGLSALHPTTRTTIYVSTFFDPRDDTTMSTKREISARDHLRQRRDLQLDAGHRALDDGQLPPDRAEVGREPHGAAVDARDVHHRAELLDEDRRHPDHEALIRRRRVREDDDRTRVTYQY